MEVNLIKCNLNCYEKSTYDFFRNDNSDMYIIAYQFNNNNGKEPAKPIYALMSKGYYKDGGIALVVSSSMLYSLGKNCYIIGYYPIDIVNKEEIEN